MPPKNDKPTPSARERLVSAGIDLFRRQGYISTRVEAICEAAGVSKGAFFHHFENKEALAAACLDRWDEVTAKWDAEAEFNELPDPFDRLVGFMDYVIAFMTNPEVFASCLPGTTVQEISETHPELRRRSKQCFENAEARYQKLITEAAESQKTTVDAASLATLWLGALQGSLIQFKATRDAAVIRNNLTHIKKYIMQAVSGTPLTPTPDHAIKGA